MGLHGGLWADVTGDHRHPHSLRWSLPQKRPERAQSRDSGVQVFGGAVGAGVLGLQLDVGVGASR